MDTDFLPPATPDAVQLREQLLDHETELRRIARALHPGGHWEARCALRDAADLLLQAGRTLAAELPPPPRAMPRQVHAAR